MGDNNTQLPAEVKEQIHKAVEAYYFRQIGLHGWYEKKAGFIAGATEYALENTQLKQWKAEAAELLNPILEYGQSKEAGIPLGESIIAVILERCKQFNTATQMLFRLASLVNADQNPDDKFLTEIKTFLDGAK